MRELDTFTNNVRRFAHLGGMAAAFVLLVSACGSSASGTTDSGPVQGKDAETDTQVVIDITDQDAQPSDGTDEKDLTVLVDTGNDGDAGTDQDTSLCPGGAGCPCKGTADCDSDYCLDSAEGQVCAKKCNDSICPSGYKCGTVAGSAGDVINVCLPDAPNLCNPCTSNTQCQPPGSSGARCIDGGQGGAFCGIACTGSDSCPKMYECKDVNDLNGISTKQCVPTSGAACTCNASAIKNEAYTTCSKTVGSSKCTGKRICLADGKVGAPKGGGLSDCLADAPEAEICDGKDNDCDGQTDEAACDDNLPCTDDTCDPKAGCSHINNNGLCDADGSVCTKDDFCLNGKCLTGKIVNCDDNNVCTDDACDSKGGCKHENNTVGCDYDDNPCTVGDACIEGKCTAGAPKACDSGSQCVVGKCSLVGTDAGKCKYDYKDGMPCEDGNACTLSDTCASDVCGGLPNKCDDNNSCTTDSCDKLLGCKHSPNTDACDDGDACTSGDKCTSGTCNGTAIDPSKVCVDNNPCTSDTCNPALGCLNKALTGVACDDGNSCSVGDKCDEKGQCLSGSNTCACDNDAQCLIKLGDNLCNGAPFCDKSGPLTACKYKANSAVICDTSSDGTCKKTMCEPSSGKCVAQLTQTGIPCDADGSVCTVDDFCKDGLCTKGKLMNCDDSKPCTADTCDAKLSCAHQNMVGDCDADGDACTVGDSCQSGACMAGTQKVCNDNEPCTTDSCNKTSGACVYAQTGASCSDGSECTTGDKCGTDPSSGKYTCIGGAGPNCDDSNPCTIDTCDPTKNGGCSHKVDASVQQVCYTGDPKTKDVGICKAGVKSCDASGLLGDCLGQVLPAASDPCDGLDNDCNGNADPGCAPGLWTSQFGNALVGGSGPSGTLTGLMSVGNVSASTSSTNWKVNFGLLSWIKAWLGK